LAGKCGVASKRDVHLDDAVSIGEALVSVVKSRAGLAWAASHNLKDARWQIREHVHHGAHAHRHTRHWPPQLVASEDFDGRKSVRRRLVDVVACGHVQPSAARSASRARSACFVASDYLSELACAVRIGVLLQPRLWWWRWHRWWRDRWVRRTRRANDEATGVLAVGLHKDAIGCVIAIASLAILATSGIAVSIVVGVGRRR